MKFMSVRQLIVFNTFVLIFKMRGGQCPEYLCSKIKARGDNEVCDKLRNRNDIETIRATRHCTQNSLFYKGVRMFNELTDELKNETDLAVFKNKLKTYVIDQYDVAMGTTK